MKKFPCFPTRKKLLKNPKKKTPRKSGEKKLLDILKRKNFLFSKEKKTPQFTGEKKLLVLPRRKNNQGEKTSSNYEGKKIPRVFVT